MKRNKILVTAANGHTGYTTAKELLLGNFDVRIFVRNINTIKAKELESLGAEIFKGNLDDYRDVAHSLIGVKRVYFCTPFDRHALLKTINFIVASEQSKVEHVVYMSQWLVSPAHPAINTREQWLAKEVALLHRKVGFTFINTGLFGFTYFFTLEMATQLGVYPTLIKEHELSTVALNSPPSEEDQGRVIAEILKNPEPHISKIYRITGPELISHKTVLDIYEKVLGRSVKPMHVSKKMLFKSLKAMGFDTYQLTNINHYLDELEKGTFSIGGGVTDVVRDITGKEAENFETIMRRELKRSDMQTRTLFSVASAAKFFMKVLFTKAPNLEKYDSQQNFPEFFKPPVYAFQSNEWREQNRLSGLADETKKSA